MMLVDGYAIPAQGFAVFQFVEEPVVELMALDRIKQRIRQFHPDSVIGARLLKVEVGIGHQMEQDDLHGITSRIRT